MPSYSSYKRQMSVLDKDDDIVSWITVKGNHIPIRKGQSKEDAVKSFLEKKGDNKKSDNGMSKGHKRLGELNKKYGTQKGYLVQTKDPLTSKKEKILEINNKGQVSLTESGSGFHERVELTDLQGKKYTTTKKELKEAGTSKFGLDPKGIKPAILEPKKVETKKFEKLTKQYMPKKGEADNELGEVLRSINRVVYRYYNDGDVWNKGYGKETVNRAVKHLVEVAKNKNTPRYIARGLENALFELKKHGVKDRNKYETALEMLTQTIEFADEKDLEALSKMKRNG